MLSIGIALFSGILFAVGLVISGMTNPDKVIGFLDLFGNWDYSLAFVMVGAIGVSLVGFKMFSHKQPTLKSEVDKNIIIGSSLFGIGWGLSGICPGPGIVNLVTNESGVFVFVGSLIIGMLLYKYTEKYWV